MRSVMLHSTSGSAEVELKNQIRRLYGCQILLSLLLLDRPQSRGQQKVRNSMALPYGCIRSKITAIPYLTSARRLQETQYHLHATLKVGPDEWDTAINVGTNDSDDFLKYRIAYDFHHPIINGLINIPVGIINLTGQHQLPSLDFLRSDLLSETGAWRVSDPMDGSEHPDPIPSIMRLLQTASENQGDLYVFGRFFTHGNGIHDTHMNQGSRGKFIHYANDDSHEHNDIWQDGALIVSLSPSHWIAYFAAFEKQYLPTDDLGNPTEVG
jgi:uncharacterized protein YukJ